MPHRRCKQSSNEHLPGTQLGNAAWELYLLEHGLKADGKPDPDATDIAEGGSYDTFFTQTGSGKYVPRSIFVDLDPSVCVPTPRRTTRP